MRCPGGSPKTTSWHRDWWDLEGREACTEPSVERCSELDSDSGRGHVERQVPARCETARATLSSLAASLAFVLWLRSLTAETFAHPRAALGTGHPAQHEG